MERYTTSLKLFDVSIDTDVVLVYSLAGIGKQFVFLFEKLLLGLGQLTFHTSTKKVLHTAVSHVI